MRTNLLIRLLHRLVLGALCTAALLAASAGAARANAPSLRLSLDRRSYAPGERVGVRLEGQGVGALALRIFAVGAEAAPFARSAGHDPLLTAVPRTAPEILRLHRAPFDTVALLRTRDWASGVYAVRARADGLTRYALFVLRPARLGESRVLVVEPTNTWQAYNFENGDSWYENPEVRQIALDRAYPGNGLPTYFRDYDLGFLRWLWRTGRRADFVADDDLERVSSAALLRRRYRLIVFPGHEEYVTAQTYALVRGFRNRGGNLAFLSADSFFYRVEVAGDTMTGRTRWRDVGLPEATLVGAEYAGWDERRFRNRPYTVVNTGAAPWLFAGTGLRDGARFGNYGIEIDETTPASPRDVHVVASAPGIFGPGTAADMTLYQRGNASVFDAGAMNFGGSADWPVVSRLVSNLWQHLDR